MVSRLNGGVFFAQLGLLGELRRLGASGDRYELFGGADACEKEDESLWGGVPVHACARRGPAALGWLPSLRRELGSFAPALVHSHGLWSHASWASGQFCRKEGIPLLVSPHGMLDPWALALSRTKKKMAWALFEHTNLAQAVALHALNAAEAASIRRVGLTVPVIVIPNGVSLPPLWENPARENKTLLFLGRLHPKKGLLPLLEAWLSLATDMGGTQGWTLQIAGFDENGFEKQLRALAGASSHADSIVFLGPLWGERKAKALAEASAFVLPSYSEGLPMAVLEAWSYAKPVLMSQACNLPEGFKARAAWEAEPEVEQLRAVLQRLFSADQAELDASGAAGRLLVERRFSWASVAKDILRVYTAAVARQPLPADLVYPG